MQALQAQSTADVSPLGAVHTQMPLRAAELVRAELTKSFGPKLAAELVDRALRHEAVQGSQTPLADLRAVVAGDLMNRVGELLVATAEAVSVERAAQGIQETGRITAPETPLAIDRSEVRRALS
jgi:hypothetical protein